MISYLKTYANQTVLGFKFLGRVQGVVDEGESSRLASTKSSAETKDKDVLLVGLVQFRELFTEVILGDVGASRVQDVDDLKGWTDEW
jgi:hypothetical protein